MAKSPAKQSAKSDRATLAALASEKSRATALAKQYAGGPELLTLAEASKVHPPLDLTAEDLANTAYFHLRFRPCSICGRFPARALVHFALHESGRLDAKGHRTDAEGRAAIALRVAKALKTLASEKAPAKGKARKAA